jgi:hypothetical protein
MAVPFAAGPMVRIRFPPAASQQRTVPALAPIARRGAGETIRAALLCADLRDFTALSGTTEPAQPPIFFTRPSAGWHVVNILFGPDEGGGLAGLHSLPTIFTGVQPRLPRFVPHYSRGPPDASDQAFPPAKPG